MLVHREDTSRIKFTGTQLYTRGTVREKCLAQEQNAISQPRLRHEPFDRVERTYHEVTAAQTAEKIQKQSNF